MRKSIENINSCFDYETLQKTNEKINDLYSGVVLERFGNTLGNNVEDLRLYDKTHEVLATNIEILESIASQSKRCFEELGVLKTGINDSIKAYKNAEGENGIDMSLFLPSLATIIKDTLDNDTVSSYITDGKVKQGTVATSTAAFLSGASEEVTEYMSKYALYVDKNHDPNYESAEEWKKQLMKKYQNLGYSSYDADDLANAEMAKWRLAQTGAAVTSNAIAAHAINTHSKLKDTVKAEYDTLVQKYKAEGYTENQAKELATAESEYIDAKELAKNEKYGGYGGEVSEKKQELAELKEKYKPEEKVPDNQTSGSNPEGSGGENGGGTSDKATSNEPNKIQQRVENKTLSTLQSNNPANAVTKPIVQDKVDLIPEAKPEVVKPDNTPNPLPDTKPETNTPQPLPDNKPDNSGAGVSDNTNTNTNTDTNTSTNTNENTNSPSTSTSTGGASTYRPNNNAGGNASTNSGTVQAPQEPAVSTTTPTTPDTTTGTNSGAGDSLDVISIDKETPKTTGTTTNSSGGSNVIPIGLGVAAAGAAAVAGVRYIKNKTNKEDDDTNYEEGDTSFSYLGDYHEDKTNDNYEEKISTGSDLYNETIEEPSKYKAGSVNKLVLDTGEDIKIEDDEMINQKEELE